MFPEIAGPADLFRILKNHDDWDEFFIYGNPKKEKWVVTNEKIIAPMVKKAYAVDDEDVVCC